VTSNAGMLLRGHHWLRATSWSYLLGLAFFLIAISLLMSIGAEAGSSRATLVRIMKAAVGFLLLGKLLSGGYGGLGRYRAAADSGAPVGARAAAFLPPWLLAWPRMDRTNLMACVAWMRRQPHPPRPAGIEIGFGDKSSYSTTVLIVLFSALVDLPLNAFIASVISRDPTIQLRIHLGCGALAIYMLMWILGDRYLIAGSFQVVGDSALHLKIAGRFSATIPLSAITQCEPVSERADAWCKGRGLAKGDALAATPADMPNVMIAIDPAAGVRLTSWQVERAAPRYLLLFVGQPSALAAALGKD
jgi:hypothetical protein